MDTNLLKEAFYIYITSESEEEYKKRLKELSKKSNKTDSFLRNLRDDYYNMYADEEEKKQYLYIKERNRVNRMSYIKVVETLLNASDKEKESYLETTNYKSHDIKEFCQIYIKNCKDENMKKKAKEIYDWIEMFYTEKSKKQSDDRKVKILEKAHKFFMEIIQGGFYLFSDYVNHACSKHGKEKYLFKRETENAIRYLKSVDKKTYDLYIKEMENNRMNIFNLYKNNIRDFILMIESHDIIDYYLMFNMPIVTFRRICKGFIGEKEEHILNIFFSNYKEVENCIFNEEKLLSTSYYINDSIVPDYQKITVFNFIKEHKIPNAYYYIALKKYVNGDLIIKQEKGPKL